MRGYPTLRLGDQEPCGRELRNALALIAAYASLMQALPCATVNEFDRFRETKVSLSQASGEEVHFAGEGESPMGARHLVANSRTSTLPTQDTDQFHNARAFFPSLFIHSRLRTLAG